MIKAGLIGCGFMGALHSKAYSQLDEVEFIGIYDLEFEKAEKAAKEYKTKALRNYTELIESCDVLSIASPTITHYFYAKECLNAGRHVLIEKPIAASFGQAQELVNIAKSRNVIIAVGLIERFNPCVIKLMELIQGNEIIEIVIQRLAPPLERANDVSAVFDLMIHDIDIVYQISKSRVKNIKASGEKINSRVFNSVHAEILFNNGIKADLSANKTADEKIRNIKIISQDKIYEADLIAKKIVAKTGLQKKYYKVEGREPIMMEILDFLQAVACKAKPSVSGEDALSSLKIAYEIESIISK